MQIVPKGKKWTSAFNACAGGYLASNHIALLGLTRFGEGAPPTGSHNDWTTAVNFKFQRGKRTVENILAWDGQGTLHHYVSLQAS